MALLQCHTSTYTTVCCPCLTAALPPPVSLLPAVALQARLLRRMLPPAPRVVAGAPVCLSARLPPLPVRLLGPLVMMEAAALSLLHRQLQRHQA
jgi:hypothetical protein